ncbi:MAG: hypothetical protein KatS3mg043_2127 [Rhodothermaceae bacterium]|nr:MAG: hypothetical protein KatS3mg043_2127 [Rhodothermaceae bacterium]
MIRVNRLLLVFLFSALVAGQETRGQDVSPDCEPLVRRARALYHHRHLPDSLHARIEVARRARACLGTPDAEQAGFLYLDEIDALVGLGRTGEALARYGDYLDRYGPRADSLWLCAMHHRRGYLHYTLGHYGRALSDYARAVTYAPPLGVLRLASLSLDLGVLHAFVRDYEAARRLFEQVDTLTRALTPAEVSDPAALRRLRAHLPISLADLMLTRYVQEDTGTTRDLQVTVQQYETAAAQLAPLNLPDRLARVHLQLAETHAYLGDTVTARRHLEQATRLAAPLHNPVLDHLVAHKTALVHLVFGEDEAAEAALRQALVRAAELPPSHRTAATHNLAGFLAEKHGDRWGAIAHYERAAELTEIHRADLGTTELSLAAFADWQEPYRGLVRVYLAAGRVEEAFMALERTRARHLLDVRGEMDALHTADPATRARYDSLTAVITNLRTALQGTPPAARRLNLQHRLTLAQFERSALLPATSPLTPAAPEAVRERLARQNRVLLSYFIDKEDRLLGRRARSAVFVLTPDTLVAVPLAVSEAELRALLARVSPLLSGSTEVSLNRLHFDNTVLHELYRVLFAPAAAFVPPGSRLTVLPDGPLFMFPFGMLVEAEAPRYAYREAPYLFKKYPISVDVAAALLLEEPPPGDPSVEVLALGKTRYNEEAIRAWFRTTGLADETLPNLPAVRREITALGRLFARARTLLDEQATETALFEQDVPPRVLHLASHVIVHPKTPLYNAFFLSPDPAAPEYDGVVYLYELQRRPFRVHLVTLSGCSTARGTYQPGEGMAGLQQTFRELGVPSSVATLWLADDETTARLMETFYRYLRDGLPKDVALQQARLEFLEEAPPSKASPFFWAGPVLFGSVDPIPLTPRRPPVLPWLLLIFACVLPLSAYIFWRRRSTSRRVTDEHLSPV